jgi:adenylate kinase family enzyme
VRVVVLGNSGSGKSTLAAALAATAGVPCLDMDTVAWERDRPAVPRTEALALDDIAVFCGSHENWVVEGCYANLAAAALELAPKLILLNPGLEACLANCRSRPWEPHKYPSKRAQDANLEFLLSWVEEYYTRNGPMSLAGHQDCFGSYAGPKRELLSVPALRPVEPQLLAWVRSA